MMDFGAVNPLPMNRATLRCLGLSVGIAIALGGCREQTWPKDNDVYHRQIVLPPADGDFRGGIHFFDEKTGKIEPEVCDTYGSGQTVCSEASFDPAAPVAQFRADLAKKRAAWEKENRK